jgi:hypothetical protein
MDLCALGGGKFSWQDLTFGPLSMQPIDKRTQTIASQPSQLILIHPMDDFGWSGRDPRALCDGAGWFLISSPWTIQLARSHFWAIIHATN